MKPLRIIGITFLVSLFFSMGLCPRYSEAQPPKVPNLSAFSQRQVKGACQKDPSITFTEEQTKELENLGQAFLEETKPLRDEMMDLRLGLRFAVSDPRAPSRVLLDKQRRMSSIQAQLENLRFSYLIRARAIFTKEQLERMPRDCPLKKGIEYGMGGGLERRGPTEWR